MLRRHGLLLGLFLALALVLTWPLVRRLASFVPGSDTWAYDEYTFIWSMWWFKHSLLDLRSSILFSGNIFYPLGMDLILYTYTLMAALLALPLGLATNWVVASNLHLIFGIVISGYGAYLLAFWMLRQAGAEPGGARGAALVAGLIFAFSSPRSIYLALGHYNIQGYQYLPFFVLYLLRLAQRPSWRHLFLTALFGVCNLLVDIQYGVYLVFLAACLLLTQPWRALLWRAPLAARRWLALVGAGALAVMLILPYFWAIAQSFTRSDFLLSGWGDALKLSADLAGWFTPTALHPVWGTDWPRALRAVQEGTAPFRDINTVFLGYITLALALVGAVYAWRRARGWVVTALASALFTLGPLLQIRGQHLFDFDGLQTSFPLPFLLLHYLPFVKGNRAANRWSVVLMLALAMLAAWAVVWLWDAVARRRKEAETPARASVFSSFIVLLLAAAILFEHAAFPLPTTDARIPPAIQQMAGQPPGAVLQIPMGWRNSFGVLGAEDTRAQYYMVAHGQPILSGNTSRNPPIKFDYFARLPLVQALTQQEFGHPPSPETLTAARTQMSDLLALWGVRYLMLLPPVPGRLPYADTWQASQQLALGLVPHSPQPLLDDGSVRIFGVEPGSPLPLTLDFGGRVTDAWRGEGWSTDEADVGGASGIWASDRRAHLLFRSEDATPRRLSFRAAPFIWPAASSQRLHLLLNDHRLGEITLAEDWREYSFDITPQPGINHLWLDFDRADSPRAVLRQAMIGTTGIQAPVDIEVHSFDQAYITLTAATGVVTPASAGRRGYNVTVLDAEDGRVLDQQGFDAVANDYEVERLIAYLNQIAEGRIVILATREGAGDRVSASAPLSAGPNLIAALQRIGSGVTDPAALANHAHALVGVVGAPPGAAAEVIHPTDAFLRIVGDSRTLAAAFDWLRIE